MIIFYRFERCVKRRLSLTGKRRMAILQFVRIGYEVVVLLIPVGVFDVKETEAAPNPKTIKNSLMRSIPFLRILALRQSLR